MYDNKLYTIKTLSNLHVGGGDVNYSVIDKQVQRDVLTKYPSIQASSFKGAMKEYVKYKAVSDQDLNQHGEVNEETPKAGDKLIRTVFGQDPKESQQKKEGSVIFTEVKLLSLPVRTNKKSFLRATCPALIAEYNEVCRRFGFTDTIEEFLDDDNFYYAKEIEGEIIVEEMDFKIEKENILQELEKHLGKDVVLLTDAQFKQIASSLPVLARNHLEDGESKNLFYEEVVPRESLFYTVLRYPNKNLLSLDPRDKQAVDNIGKFQKMIETIDFYMGANTSIGQGYCQLNQIASNSNKG